MCGLFGIINQKEDLFDYKTFCSLGVANDRRGGDSCGIFIDGKTEYGIKDTALFEAFFWNSKLLQETLTARIAIGHDRRASVGGISLEKAHPILIKETVDCGNGETTEKVMFVLIHNGTISNYESLAKKYIPEIDIKNMSDSQVLAQLLYHTGYDFLAEYQGGAAFVAVDYRKQEPEIILWRGESKKFSYSTKAEEERPLFFNITNNRLVFSSIASYIEILDGDCYIVPANKVLKYYDGKLWDIKSIDRSAVYQTKNYTTQWSESTFKSSKWLIASTKTNTYKVEGELADGSLRITNLGKVLGKYDGVSANDTPHTIWFFNGVPIKEKRAYQFLTKAEKRSGLKTKEFMNRYQKLVRYFSYDQLYMDEDRMYKAISPWMSVLYTGDYQRLAEARCISFLCGIEQPITKLFTTESSFTWMKRVVEFDYKTIWKEFIQSIQ